LICVLLGQRDAFIMGVLTDSGKLMVVILVLLV
jgi:hypothetical protein